MKKGMYIGVIVLLAVAFIASAAYLGNYFVQSKKQAARYDELAQIAQGTTEAPETTEGTISEEDADPDAKPIDESFTVSPNYEELHKQNEDLVGWIKIDGTSINYPVMQTSMDNKDFYLYRNFDKKSAACGSIYVREECDVFKPSDNVTIYGHHMKDGSMFAALDAYYEKSAWEKNSLIMFDTLNEYHVYKIFAVFKTTAVLNEGFPYHRFENAANADEFNEFVATCKKLSFYDTGITPAYGDKLICLSTCEYTLEDGRLVVAAVRIT